MVTEMRRRKDKENEIENAKKEFFKTVALEEERG
jgi:hypothetical protein